MESKLRLKDSLFRLFRPPALLLSASCGSCRSTVTPPTGKAKKIKKKERRVRENGKLYMTGEAVDQDGRTCPPTSPSSPSKIDDRRHHHYHYLKEEKNKRTTKQKKMKKKTRELSSSSAMERFYDFGFFSSEEEREGKEEEDTETFFSSDSSGFYKKEEKMKSCSRRRLPPGRREKKSRCIWINDGFQPLVSISRRIEEEEEAGFAVTKKSSDPYGDFQSSMVEMIVERQIFGARELQWLLHSYLSLNSAQNHPVILKAFADISQVLFSY